MPACRSPLIPTAYVNLPGPSVHSASARNGRVGLLSNRVSTAALALPSMAICVSSASLAKLPRAEKPFPFLEPTFPSAPAAHVNSFAGFDVGAARGGCVGSLPWAAAYVTPYSSAVHDPILAVPLLAKQGPSNCRPSRRAAQRPSSVNTTGACAVLLNGVTGDGSAAAR